MAEQRNRFNLRIPRQNNLETYIISMKTKKVIRRRLTEEPVVPKSILKMRPRAKSVCSKNVSFNIQDDQSDSKRPSSCGQNKVLHMITATLNENGRLDANNHQVNQSGENIQFELTGIAAANNPEVNQVGNALAGDIVVSNCGSRDIVLCQPNNNNELQPSANEIVNTVVNIAGQFATGTETNNITSHQQSASEVFDQDIDEDMLLAGAESFSSNECYVESALLNEDELNENDTKPADNPVEGQENQMDGLASGDSAISASGSNDIVLTQANNEIQSTANDNSVVDIGIHLATGTNTGVNNIPSQEPADNAAVAIVSEITRNYLYIQLVNFFKLNTGL